MEGEGRSVIYISLVLALVFYYVHSEKGSDGFSIRTAWKTYLIFTF